VNAVAEEQVRVTEVGGEALGKCRRELDIGSKQPMPALDGG
jgi:hypothetical protein